MQGPWVIGGNINSGNAGALDWINAINTMSGMSTDGPEGLWAAKGRRLNPESTDDVDLYITRTASTEPGNLILQNNLLPSPGEPAVDSIQLATRAGREVSSGGTDTPGATSEQ